MFCVYVHVCVFVGSGVSLLSELEHQLGLRSSRSRFSPPTHKPGEDTLAEEEDKRRFFEELERGKESPLDYSELNRQLSNTSISMRYGGLCTHVHVYCTMLCKGAICVHVHVHLYLSLVLYSRMYQLTRHTHVHVHVPDLYKCTICVYLYLCLNLT